MGAVYLARSRSGRTVAVKVIRMEFVTDPDFRRRFAREVAAAQAVSGPYTAAVVDADPEAAEPWLATAYVPGPSLWHAVRDGELFDERRVVELGAGLAEALVSIHAAGVVHRDLKPQNVLLAPDGPCVIDFGIARISGSSAITVEGVFVGTPEFMSPEQFSSRRIDGASDVFSLGSVLVFAATGHGPFGSGSSEQLWYRIVHEEPDLTGVPAGLTTLIRHCLAKRPETRPRPADLVNWLASRVTEHTALRPLPPEPDPYADRYADPYSGVGPGPEPAPGPGPEPDPAPEPAPTHPPTLVDPGPAAPDIPVPPGRDADDSLALDAHALLLAGLTDELVIEAVGHGGRQGQR
jgi:serine/threonine protein kinase